MTRPFRMSEHRSFPKPTPRLQDRVQQRREALRAWQACVRAVDARDQYRCRSCTRRTRQTYTVCPERLEHHHLVGRNVAPHLVADTRNVRRYIAHTHRDYEYTILSISCCKTVRRICI